jgi:hypothetical protein
MKTHELSPKKAILRNNRECYVKKRRKYYTAQAVTASDQNGQEIRMLHECYKISPLFATLTRIRKLFSLIVRCNNQIKRVFAGYYRRKQRVQMLQKCYSLITTPKNKGITVTSNVTFVTVNILTYSG